MAGKRWSLAYVDGDDGTGGTHEAAGIEGLPASEEGAWADLAPARAVGAPTAPSPARELAQFAVIGSWEALLGRLAATAAPERWNYPGEGVGGPSRYGILRDGYPYNLQMDADNHTIVFAHGPLLFVFNWHPSASIPDYLCRVRDAGRYELILSTDELRFGGTERARIGSEHFTEPLDNGDGTTSPAIRIYNTSRTAAVYRLKQETAN